jgi:hypothetical protein
MKQAAAAVGFEADSDAVAVGDGFRRLKKRNAFGKFPQVASGHGCEKAWGCFEGVREDALEGVEVLAGRRSRIRNGKSRGRNLCDVAEVARFQRFEEFLADGRVRRDRSFEPGESCFHGEVGGGGIRASVAPQGFKKFEFHKLEAMRKPTLSRRWFCKRWSRHETRRSRGR